MALFLSSERREDDKTVVVNKILILCGREWLVIENRIECTFLFIVLVELFIGLFVNTIRLSASILIVSADSLILLANTLIVSTHSFVRKMGKEAPKFLKNHEK